MMNDKDIIKALEYCSKQTMMSECEKCSVVYPKGCRTKLIEYALDLIKRQQAKIERLESECGNQSVLWSKHYESIFETAKEIVRAEAIKEFAERLIEEKSDICYLGDIDHKAYRIEEKDLETLVKEMLGKEDEGK